METNTVQRNIQELETLKKHKRFWQMGISLTLLLIVVGSLVTLRNAVSGLTTEGPTREMFVKDLGDRVQLNALPQIEEMGMRAVREVNYEGEVKKLNRRTPELAQAALKQMKLLGADLPMRGRKIFDATFAKTLKEREGKIKTMFPEATDAQVSSLVTLLTQEAQNQAVVINDSLFTPHKKALDNMVSDLTHIENEEASTTKGQVPTWEMALTIFDIARADLHDIEPKPAATSQPAAKEGKK